jgi:cellobiose phosphorylase
MTYQNNPLSLAYTFSNGRYQVLITPAGTGYSACDWYTLTRWNDDPTEDREGVFFYVRDLTDSALWSLGYQPVQYPAERYEFKHQSGKAEITRLDHQIESRLEICVAPEDDLELRRVTLCNRSDHIRRLELTSYVEVALNHPAADAAHPAFSKLFVQTEFVCESDALLAWRRPRSPEEPTLWMMHAPAGEGKEGVQYETDRARFVGRGRTLAKPLALTTNEPLSGTVGSVLDPVLSLRQIVELEAGASVRLTFLLGTALSRERVLGLVNRYAKLKEIEWVFAKVDLPDYPPSP